MINLGIVNFNSRYGCQKCTIIGEYSKIGRTMVFPRFDCALRTNETFRLRQQPEHHKYKSPLEELPLDMISQIPIGDCLHLIDLGVTKRLLFGWVNVKGKKKHLGFSMKWSHAECTQITKELQSFKMPAEIRRSVRGLNELIHWKGTEYRGFLYYLGIVLLKKHLPPEYYHHFLSLFCAITICTSIEYNIYLDVAEMLLQDFVENYIHLYGLNYITSNVHNLIHLVDEVR